MKGPSKVQCISRKLRISNIMAAWRSLQKNHIITINRAFYKNAVVADVVFLFYHLQLYKLLGPKAGVSLSDRSPKKRFVVPDDVWFNGIRHVTSSGRILALVHQGEGNPMAEWPSKQSVILPFANTNED